MRARALLLPIVLSTLACDRGGGSSAPADAPASTPAPVEVARSPAEICENARDRVTQMGYLEGQLSAQHGSEDQKSAALMGAKLLTACVHMKFVDVCLELDDDERRCMAEIDRYADAMVTALRGELDCGAGEPDGCERWYADIEAAQAGYGACREVLSRVTSAAWELGRRALDEQIAGHGKSGVYVVDDGPEPDSEIVPDLPSTAVRSADATVDGPLDRDIVRRIVGAHTNEIRSCYNFGLKRDPSLAGQVTLEFTIDARGEVSSSAAVDSDAFADPEVAKCMADAVKSWRFPKPTGGAEVRVRYPFALKSAEISSTPDAQH